MHRMLIPTALGAFGLGALVSWAVTADLNERRLVETLEGTLKIIDDKQTYIGLQKDYIGYLQGLIGQYKTGEVVPESIGPDPNQSTIDEVEALDVEEDPIPEGETPEETRTNLQNIINTYTADPDSQVDIDRFIDLAVDIEHEPSPPFVISREDYAYDEEGDSFEKITLQYYHRDRIVLDGDEDPVDVAQIVGWRNLSQFGGVSGDPDVVFVRNRRLETDFEVVKEDDRSLPLHVQFGMEREEFRVNKAAGLIRLPREDE
jgi:hypothetical protein